MYTVRLLDQTKTLLAVLPVISWSYDRKLSAATSISVKIARTEIADSLDTDELFSFLSPFQPSLQETSEDCAACIMPVLAYYLQIYRDTDMIGMGIIAKRDFSDTTISLKAHTEEHLLSLYRSPADYGIIYDNTDICDIARDLLKGWRTIRYKQNWDEATASSQVDITTEPSVVILDKDGSGVYYETGYITFEFEQTDDFDSWERIRWSADNEDPVYSTMAYKTYDGASWSAWSAEYEGALPDQIGIEIVDTDAVKVQVRITLTSADQESEDDAGDPIGSTPALFAVEIIARTTAFLTSNIPASSTVEVIGLDASEKTSQNILKDACEQVGWEFQAFNGVLTIAEAIGDDRELMFRAGTNMDITQLGDDAAEIFNYLIANGIGSGINRPQVTLKNAASITNYGIRQLVKEFDIEDPDDLETAAETYLATVVEPTYSWKIKTRFKYDETPDFYTGDTVTVVDPKSAVVTRSRIMETHIAYSGHKLDLECYLGKTRANLIPVVAPRYRSSTLAPPKSLALAATEKGLIAIVPKPNNTSLWAFTEVYLSNTLGVTAIAEKLIARERATNFTIQGLLPLTRYYAIARYVDTYGRHTDVTVKISRETLKYSTPFEDAQPVDTDPDTVGYQTEGGKVKIYNNGTIEAVDGIWKGSIAIGQIETVEALVIDEDQTDRQDDLFAFLADKVNKGDLVAGGTIKVPKALSFTQSDIGTNSESISINFLVTNYNGDSIVYIGNLFIAESVDGGTNWVTRTLAVSLLCVGILGSGSVYAHLLTYAVSNEVNWTGNPTNPASDNIYSLGDAADRWWGVTGFRSAEQDHIYAVLGGNNGKIAYTTTLYCNAAGDWTVLTKGAGIWYRGDINPATGIIIIGGSSGQIAYFTEAASVAAGDITIVTVGAGSWSKVICCPDINRWVAIGGTSVAYSDDDGATWTSQTLAKTTYDIAVDELYNRFFIIAADRTVYYSSDGITWNSTTCDSTGIYKSIGVINDTHPASIKLVVGGLDTYNTLQISPIPLDAANVLRIDYETISSKEKKITFDATEEKSIYIFDLDIVNTFEIDVGLDSKLFLKKNLLFDTGVSLETIDTTDVWP